MEKEKADAAANDNMKKLQAIAKDFGAEIFITGTANANQAGMEDLYGTPVAFYNCDAQLKVYYTDTAKLLASMGCRRPAAGLADARSSARRPASMALSISPGRTWSRNSTSRCWSSGRRRSAPAANWCSR